GIFHYFTSVIVINKETNQKKNSQTFLTCMEELGSKPDATYIVDDRTVKGIKIGNQIGCRTVRIKNGNFPHELPDEKTGKPTFIINTAEELPKILN
ncbi:HAD hydrolase-like protein, partial [Patescibacteria group bacterium]|nr:HAD hydrolase-like protein [Patescibacteria group bacterium]